jgi:mannitol-specific phosphotransferase system IIBC component
MSASQPQAVSRRTSSVLRKVGFTAAAGGIALAVQVAANQDLVLSVVLSVVVGGVSLIVQSLLVLEQRLAELEYEQGRHAGRVEARLDATFSTVNEATQLFSLLEQSARGWRSGWPISRSCGRPADRSWTSATRSQHRRRK